MSRCVRTADVVTWKAGFLRGRTTEWTPGCLHDQRFVTWKAGFLCTGPLTRDLEGGIPANGPVMSLPWPRCVPAKRQPSGLKVEAHAEVSKFVIHAATAGGWLQKRVISHRLPC
ncbi:uncharacterized protein LOC114449590 isoform X2 [Parambassis ranga]|uniref:Uncharacterized protein LOC114449590 isoform X2 n=1 Tax=Parambassis ranga TaxID=210632 RepID=A0A6P7K1Y9_9TELE|nr:uncharacterized protein LOC114449590 isoform X2 [Parambassis ranga]